jgi:hypothetical protein
MLVSVRTASARPLFAARNAVSKLQSFSAYLRGKGCQSSDVPARPRKARDEPVANRIAILMHDNGNRRSC